MPLTQAQVDELKRIYQEESGQDISDEEAWAMAHRLLALYRLVVAVGGHDPESVQRR